MGNMKNRIRTRKYAIVDLEATSSSSLAKIIQIGIVIVENGLIVDQFASDINPHEPLDDHIKDLTGISDEQLALAPEFGQVAGQIYSMLEDAVFVAHNVQFDANLLTEALFFEGYDLYIPRVDTVELSQLFFPQFEKYNLTYLAEALKLPLDQAHTAISDAQATAQLLIRIQEKILSLPRSVLVQLLPLADHLLYESRLVLDDLFEQVEDGLAANLELVHGLVLKKRKQHQAEKCFSQDFTTNIGLLDMEPRQDQVRFAEKIEQHLTDNQGVHFIQAKAGIGKTLGYLLPLLSQGKQKILVTVPTKILQEQILAKEGRLLREVFHLSITSLKAPGHFLKLDSYWKTLQREDENRLLNRFKMQILVWLCETETGDLDELKQKYRYQAYFDEIKHDGKLDKESLFQGWDFWQVVQEEAAASRLLLTNHAYYLSHLKDQDPLMQADILVIDEAQKILLAAEELASQTIDLTSLIQSLQSKKDRADSLLRRRLYESTLFELNSLLTDFRSTGQREITREKLEQLHQNCLELADVDLLDLERMLAFYSYFWLEDHFQNEKRIAHLRASREELLQLARLIPSPKIFCISATLEISKQVSLADLLGFQHATSDYLESAFQDNQELVFIKDLPDVIGLCLEEHARFLVQQLEKLLAGQQPILVLFTSRALLLAVSDLLELEEIPHLAQYKHGQADHLKRRFEKGESALLLGSGIFWEGVDFANLDQLVLVISRLPFENPRDRFVMKINQRLRQEGKHPFYDFSLPMMMMKLRQAIGRTNRRPSQLSQVFVLDNRLQTKQYGKQVARFLAHDYLVTEASLDQIPSVIHQFFDE